MSRYWRLVTVLAALLPAALADNIKCHTNSHCPEEFSCCSQYGECGTGAYCLGGCDPLSSFSLNSCVPAPVCQPRVYDWDDLDSVSPNTKYLGDASAADWVSSGQALSSGGNLILTMAPKTVGTLLSSNHYIWYGKITARMRTSRGRGVVTAFILMSDVKDEIDFEFIGADLGDAQTNYYFQGIPVWTNEISASVSDTFENYHTYTIDWQPDHITWSIDGQDVRTLKKSDTYNETTKRFEFPQTPSRLQLSLWPAGLPSSAEGTVEWAGGLVDWESEDVKKNGYYYSLIDKITVECYDPPKSAVKGSKSYIYKDDSGLESSVEISDEVVVLKSFYADGEHPDRDPNAPRPKPKETTTSSEPESTSAGATKTSSSSVTTTTSSASSTPSQNTDNLIPGMQGAGVGRPDDEDDDKDDGDKKGGSNDGKNSGSSSSDNTPANPTSSNEDDADFHQGGDDNSGATSIRQSFAAAMVAAAFVVIAL
ncbi:putative glycosidase crf2 [Ascosphaera pollenicola]|nr:putative glycosidase crf2 [Ascosphaera pollenicola]